MLMVTVVLYNRTNGDERGEWEGAEAGKYRLLETSEKRARETLRPPDTGRLFMPLACDESEVSSWSGGRRRNRRTLFLSSRSSLKGLTAGCQNALVVGDNYVSGSGFEIRAA